MAVPSYRSIKNSPETVRFGMNEVHCLVFGNGKRYHLTEGLNGCFAVYLVSTQATVSAHIPPHPGSNYEDPQAGDKNLIKKMQELAEAYQNNRKYFSDHDVALIYAKFEGKTALPDKKDFIEKCLRRFKVDFPVQDYVVKAPGEPRLDEHGTAFVDGGASRGVIVYLEDREIMRINKTTPGKTDPYTTPYSEQYHTNPIFPQTVTSDVAASTPGHPPVVRKGDDSKLSSQLKYAVSEPHPEETGARIVTIAEKKVSIQADLWQERNYQGRKVWVCQKYKLYTDL
jgi:hypothetical protein